MMNLFKIAAICLASLSMTAHAKGLSKEDALKTALENNLSYQAMISAIKAEEGMHKQASLRPNPNLYLEADNFYGEDSLRDFQSAEITFGFEQTIETANKRSKREDLAAYNLKIAALKADDYALNLLSETEFAYITLAITKERLQLAEERLQLANKMHKIIEQRIKAAKASNIDHTQIDLIVSAAKIEKSQAQKAFNMEQQKLKQLLNLTTIKVVTDQNFFKHLPKLKSEEELLENIANTTLYKIQQLQKERANSAVKLEKSYAIPDPNIGLGIKRFNNNGTTALVASLSMPISIFDRNQGNIQKARFKRLETESMAEFNKQKIALLIKDLHATISLKKQEVLSYQQELLPKAQNAYNQAYMAFKKGTFSFLNLLDVQRRVNELNKEYLNSLSELYASVTSLNRFSGDYAQLISNHKTNTKGE